MASRDILVLLHGSQVQPHRSNPVLDTLAAGPVDFADLVL